MTRGASPGTQSTARRAGLVAIELGGVPPAAAALHELLAVVAEDDDDRVVEQAALAQMSDDAADLAVDLMRRVEVAVLDLDHLLRKSADR
jgi:hypothetical protein